MRLIILDKKIYQNYDKEVCTCVIKAQIKLDNSSQRAFITNPKVGKNIKRLLEPFTVVDFSRCSDEDRGFYDDMLGEELSECRCKYRMYVEGEKRFKKFLKNVELLKKDIEDQITKCKKSQSITYWAGVKVVDELNEDVDELDSDEDEWGLNSEDEDEEEDE